MGLTFVDVTARTSAFFSIRSVISFSAFSDGFNALSLDLMNLVSRSSEIDSSTHTEVEYKVALMR